MNARSERLFTSGGAGRIEMLRDRPAGAARGVALLAHPHPLFGGTMDNKVVQTLARAAVGCGWQALRFNFRGVGASEGEHDDGRGETDDLLALIDAMTAGVPWVLGGFSFGASVALRALARLAPDRWPQHLVLVGTATSRLEVPPLAAGLHERALVVHGEADDTVPLASVLDWARPQGLPVLVVPGGGHFFHGQLPLLKGLVARHLRAGSAP